MNRIILFYFLVSLLACSKADNSVPVPSNQLVGTWRLTTYCKPASNATCTTIDVPATKNVFIRFGNAGEFSEIYENTKPVEYAFLGCGSGDYVIEDGHVRIRAMCMSSTQGQLIKLISVSDNALVMNPFETGEYRFVKQ